MDMAAIGKPAACTDMAADGKAAACTDMAADGKARCSEKGLSAPGNLSVCPMRKSVPRPDGGNKAGCADAVCGGTADRGLWPRGTAKGGKTRAAAFWTSRPVGYRPGKRAASAELAAAGAFSACTAGSGFATGLAAKAATAERISEAAS